MQHGFTGPDIAAMLGVSLRTVRRRISNFGLSIRGLYSNLSDVELDPLVTEICSAFPDIGYRRLLGELVRGETYEYPEQEQEKVLEEWIL